MRGLFRWLGVTLGLVLVVAGMPAGAGGYEILEGKGTELCEVCLQNLLRQSAEEAVCDRQYASELGLHKVEWAPLNLVDHTGLLMRMDNLINGGNESAKGILKMITGKRRSMRKGGQFGSCYRRSCLSEPKSILTMMVLPIGFSGMNRGSVGGCLVGGNTLISLRSWCSRRMVVASTTRRRIY